jgi:hypothetical protein
LAQCSSSHIAQNHREHLSILFGIQALLSSRETATTINHEFILAQAEHIGLDAVTQTSAKNHLPFYFGPKGGSLHRPMCMCLISNCTSEPGGQEALQELAA